MAAHGQSPDEIALTFLAHRELDGLRMAQDIACGLQVEQARLIPACPTQLFPHEFYPRVGGLVGQVVEFGRVPVSLTSYLENTDDPMAIPAGVQDLANLMSPRESEGLRLPAVVALGLTRYNIVPPRSRHLAACLIEEDDQGGACGSAYFVDRTNPHYVGMRLDIWSNMDRTKARHVQSFCRPLVEVTYNAKHEEQPPRVVCPQKYGQTPEDIMEAHCVMDDYLGWLAMMAARYGVPIPPNKFLSRDWRAGGTGQTGSGATC